MEDKEMMESILQTTKGLCGLLLHGTIESSTEKNNMLFLSALTRTLRNQFEIFSLMKQNNWYQVEQVEQQKIQKVINKFSN